MFCGGFATVSVLSIRQVIISNRTNPQKLVIQSK